MKKIKLYESDSAEVEAQRFWVFAVLMGVGGFFGAFTYSVRGGVFCNAQTANFVLFAMALGRAQWGHALYFFIPMSAYFLGSVLSEAASSTMEQLGWMRWDTLLILVEMVTVVFLGLLPESTPFAITQVVINFICSMQYNTFRKTQGIPMATTFCTNHVRQMGIFFAKAVRHRNWDHVGRLLCRAHLHGGEQPLCAHYRCAAVLCRTSGRCGGAKPDLPDLPCHLEAGFELPRRRCGRSGMPVFRRARSAACMFGNVSAAGCTRSVAIHNQGIPARLCRFGMG